MRKYICEFIGTTFLVLTICATAATGAPLAPLAIGAVLTAMIFAAGHISGAQFNPAVTVAVLIRGKMPASDVPGYLAAQVLGGLAGVGLAGAGGLQYTGKALTISNGDLLGAAILETAVTFALAYVVLNVATSKDHPGNSFYGLAIGFTVLSGAIAVGPVTGGVFNPAVAVAVVTGGLISSSLLWLYLVTGLAGGALAAVAFRALNPDDIDETPEGGDDRVPAPRAADSEIAEGVR